MLGQLQDAAEVYETSMFHLFMSAFEWVYDIFQ